MLSLVIVFLGGVGLVAAGDSAVTAAASNLFRDIGKVDLFWMTDSHIVS
jgi:hypothetical protein